MADVDGLLIMRRFPALLPIVLALGLPAAATDLRPLAAGDESGAFSAVGRLNFGPEKFCTGTLVAPELVLTAAHCLYDRFTGQMHGIDGAEFLAGWRDGRAEAHRGARRAVIHPDYDFGATDLGGLASDLALVELDRPIADAEIAALVLRGGVGPGDEVGVVSYTHDRAERPALQQVCHVLAAEDGAVVTSCDVDFGASGAPVLSFANGAPEVVAVVSAMADLADEKVSIGAGVAVEPLMAELAQGGEFVQQAGAPAPTLPVETPRGAEVKVLRP